MSFASYYDNPQALSARGARGSAVGGRQSALDRFGKARQIERLGQKFVDSGGLARAPVVRHRAGGQRKDRHAPLAQIALERADRARGRIAVEARQPDVHGRRDRTGTLRLAPPPRQD